MQRHLTALLCTLSLVIFSAINVTSANAQSQQEVKDWTILVFLNGHNNLDSFGAQDINEMEKIGSTQNINVVVQWASSAAKTTKRLLVKKDSNPNKVTSPVVQDMPRVDMGDYRNLVEFVRWAAQNYPAKHYFIDVWDHGSGWHNLRERALVKPLDISWDDFSGNSITTEQLAEAMAQSASIIGHKVDIYGSDACLMAMLEVSSEMKDSVEYFVGSEEVEPGKGWPYDTFLQGISNKPDISPADVSKVLAQEYTKSYQGGSQGNTDVTFSAFDLSKSEALENAVRSLATTLKTLSAADLKKVVNAAKGAQYFTNDDYRDVGHFVQLLAKAKIQALDSGVLTEMNNALKGLVIANYVTSGYSTSTGASFWLPTDSYSYSNYSARYAHMKFNVSTGWGDALDLLTK